MKKIISLLLLLSSITGAVADTKISQLPLGSAAATNTNDSFPYVNSIAGTTDRLDLSDLVNLPAFVSEFSLLVPSQTGQSGKCLGTNGTITAWISCGSSVTTGNLTSTPTTNLVITGGTGAVVGSGALLTLTGASIVESTSSVLTLGGATNAVLGTGVTIQVKQAATAQSGYLSSTDWNTFNGKQASGSYITALTGDVTAAGPGSSAATIANSAVTNAKMANMNAHTYKGNNTGSAAAPIDVTNTQLTADLNVFTSLLNGSCPASGGGTTNFLRADGTWAVAGSGTVTAVSVASSNGFAGSSSGGSTPALTLSTTITGVIKGNGTALSAATSGTDYSLGTSGNTTGIVKSTTGTGALTTAIAADFPTLNQSTSGTAAIATTGTTVASTTNASFFPLFAASSTNSNQPFNLGAGLTFNPSTNALTTTTFVGALTGHASLDPLKTNNLSDVTSTATAFNNLAPLQTSQNGLFLSTTGAAPLWTPANVGQYDLLLNPVFSASTFSTSWTATNATFTADLTNYHSAITSGLMTMSAQTGLLLQDVTPTVQLGGTQLEYSAWVKTSLSNVQVCARNAGATIGTCAAVSNGNLWQYVYLSFPGPSSGSVGISVGTTSSSTGSFNVDDLYVGPIRNTVGSGITVTALAPYTLTIGGSTSAPTLGSTSVNNAQWRQNGPMAEIQYQLHETSLGTVGSGTYLFPLPSGLVVDTTKITPDTSGKTAIVGTANATISGSPVYILSGSVFVYDTTHLAIVGVGSNTSPAVTVPGVIGSAVFALSNADIAYNFTASVPIAGWANQVSVNSNAISQPTIQKFLSGSGTYITPNGVTRLEIEIVGGGGGGAGSTNSVVDTTAAGVAGGNTTFGTSILTANGGQGGPNTNTRAHALGGTCTVNAPAISQVALPGQAGGAYSSGSSTAGVSSAGGNSPFFNGAGLNADAISGPSEAATANTGSGGGGALANFASSISGAGGAGGCGIRAIIPNPSTSYPYSIGIAGTAGIAGAGGFAGGTGSAGQIIVTEYYGMNAPILIGSVTTNAPAAWRIETAAVTNTSAGVCTINTQSGAWLSGTTPVAAGNCVANIAAGMFSSKPNCTVTAEWTGVSSTVAGAFMYAAPTTSTVSIYTGFQSGASTFALTAATVDIICMGPR